MSAVQGNGAWYPKTNKGAAGPGRGGGRGRLLPPKCGHSDRTDTGTTEDLEQMDLGESSNFGHRTDSAADGLDDLMAAAAMLAGASGRGYHQRANGADFNGLQLPSSSVPGASHRPAAAAAAVDGHPPSSNGDSPFQHAATPTYLKRRKGKPVRSNYGDEVVDMPQASAANRWLASDLRAHQWAAESEGSQEGSEPPMMISAEEAVPRGRRGKFGSSWKHQQAPRAAAAAAARAEKARLQHSAASMGGAAGAWAPRPRQSACRDDTAADLGSKRSHPIEHEDAHQGAWQQQQPLKRSKSAAYNKPGYAANRKGAAKEDVEHADARPSIRRRGSLASGPPQPQSAKQRAAAPSVRRPSTSSLWPFPSLEAKVQTLHNLLIAVGEMHTSPGAQGFSSSAAAAVDLLESNSNSNEQAGGSEQPSTAATGLPEHGGMQLKPPAPAGSLNPPCAAPPQDLWTNSSLPPQPASRCMFPTTMQRTSEPPAAPSLSAALFAGICSGGQDLGLLSANVTLLAHVPPLQDVQEGCGANGLPASQLSSVLVKGALMCSLPRFPVQLFR